MSKNITIQEGGVGKQFTAIKLRTNQVGGGSCDWIPEDELGEKTITANGTYSASDDGLFGWSRVTVNVPTSSGGSGGGSGTGTGTGGTGITSTGQDGNEYNYNTDGSGNIVETKLPSSIEVTTLPRFTTYFNGATIGKEGMVVKAYYGDGTEYGIINNDEITLNPTQAAYDAKSGITIDLEDTSILQFPANNPIVVSEVSGSYNMPSPNSVNGYVYDVSGSGVVYVVHCQDNTSSSHNMEWLSKAPFTLKRGWGEIGKVVPNETINVSLINDEYAGDYYLARAGTSREEPPFPVNPFANGFYTPNDFARQIWADGERQAGMTQTITVSWPRPADGEVLTTTFEITVTASSGGGTGGNGSGTGGSTTVPEIPEGVTVADLNAAVYAAVNAGQEYIYIDGQQYTIAEAQAMIDYLTGNT